MIVKSARQARQRNRGIRSGGAFDRDGAQTVVVLPEIIQLSLESNALITVWLQVRIPARPTISKNIADRPKAFCICIECIEEPLAVRSYRKPAAKRVFFSLAYYREKFKSDPFG